MRKSWGTARRFVALTRHEQHGPHDALPASFAPYGPVHRNDEPLEPTMIRTLLTTSAIAAVLSVSAIAQDSTTTPAPTEPTVGQQLDTTLENAGEALENAGEAVSEGAQNAGQAVDNAVNDAATNIASATRTPWEFSAGYTISADDFIVNDLLGAPVYSSGADDAQEIGKVNDLIVTADGDINAVVIGVGGFLGIGEKNVAVDYLSLEYTMAADNTWRWVLPTTAEALEAAPEFIWEDPRAPAPVMDPAMDTMAPAPVVSQ
jgi:sporulation protein YlmC with PRC-barrel domain